MGGIIINIFDNYQNTKHELGIFEKRLNLILKYEERFKEEKIKLNEMIALQKKILFQMEKDLKELDGIENKLYSEIVINGMRVSKAIDKIAMEEEKDVSTLWKNYYPKVKRKIDNLYMVTSGEILEKDEIPYLEGGKV